MSSGVQTFLLLRHATAERGPAGGRDADRHLTAAGHAEAGGLGDFLRSSGRHVDHVLCSPAVRTRETLEQLALGTGPAGPVVELEPRLYQASTSELLELLGLAAGTGAATILVVGHAPAVPTAVEVLAGAGSSAVATATLATGYPPGTLAVLTAPTGTLGPQAADLVEVRIPPERRGRQPAS